MYLLIELTQWLCSHIYTEDIGGQSPLRELVRETYESKPCKGSATLTLVGYSWLAAVCDWHLP